MTESKKKTTKKEVVEKNDDVVKPVKKAKVKETKEKLIEQALEEEILPVQEEAVKAKPPKKEAEAVNAEETGTSQPGDEEIREVSAEVKKEKVILDNLEHSNYKWVIFKEALRKITWPNQKKSLRIVNSLVIHE